ncbi:TSUP family transporter [Chloroflexota bacterium]
METLDIFSLPWILVFCAVIFAAYVRGVVGFGFALVLAPIMLLILNPKSVVVVNLLLGLISSIMVLRYGFRNIYLKGIAPMAVSSLLGVPLGLWIITIIAPSTLKMLIGGATIIFAIPLAVGFTRTFLNERLACSISGFLSGILATSTSLGGPPVVLLMHNQS